jgi:transcriptional regulator with XRE-family HTH domain
VLADRVHYEMRRRHYTQRSLAVRMGTSATVVGRLLDPTDTGVTLATLVKAALALGLELQTLFAPKIATHHTPAFVGAGVRGRGPRGISASVRSVPKAAAPKKAPAAGKRAKRKPRRKAASKSTEQA